MRLLIVNYEFPPFGGGASYSSRSLARGLVRRGHRVDILTSRVGRQPRSEEHDGMLIHRARIWRRSIHDCGIIGAGMFTMNGMVRMHQLLKQRPYDLVHCYFALPCGPLGLVALAQARVPYVLSMRGSDVPNYDPTDRLLKILHGGTAPLLRKVVSRAAVVIPNSESLRQLITASCPAGHFEVVPNAGLVTFKRRKVTDSGGMLRLLCVSRLITRKGIDVLLHAMKINHDLPAILDIVGDGRQMQRLRNLAAKLDLGSAVVFHGARRHSEVLRKCAAADIFVLPTLSESCSMAVIEAMSAGLPIITTRVGGNGHLVIDGENGALVDAGNPQSLAEALRMLIVDPARRAAMGHASTERIQREFDPTAHVARYEDIYARVVSGQLAR